MTTIPPEYRPDYRDVDAGLCDDLEAYLREHDGIGRENGIPTAEIADALDVDDSHDTKPKIRAAKQKCLFERGVPIRGGSQGLYLVAPGDDLETTIDGIRSRIAALNAAKQALEVSVEDYEYPNGDADTTDDDQRCEACGGEITGDPWLWFDFKLCRECHDAAPGLKDAMVEFVENGGASA